jgi:hypothetical protein
MYRVYVDGVCVCFVAGKGLDGLAHPSPLNMGYLMPYPYANGSPTLQSMVSTVQPTIHSSLFACFRYRVGGESAFSPYLCNYIPPLRQGNVTNE